MENGATAELSFQGEVAGFVQLDIAVLVLNEIADGEAVDPSSRAKVALREMGLRGDAS